VPEIIEGVEKLYSFIGKKTAKTVLIAGEGVYKRDDKRCRR
jgi:hypothetical protein